jgi:hypothetical protein
MARLPPHPALHFCNNFVLEGLEWSPALCRLDSDDDGLTNGDELGDGCCDGSGANGHLISHPGARDGDCGALPCRSDKPSCGATSLAHNTIEALKNSMSVKTSRDIIFPSASSVYSHPTVLSWSFPSVSLCACSIVVRAGTPYSIQSILAQHL